MFLYIMSFYILVFEHFMMTYLDLTHLESVVEISEPEEMMELIGQIERALHLFVTQRKATDDVTEILVPPDQENDDIICHYSETPLVRPPLLHQKSGLSRGVASRQG